MENVFASPPAGRDLPLADFLRRFWPGLAAVLAAFVFVYADQFAGLYHDWSNDENYSHGFIVPLVSGYFVYLRRHQLAKAKVSPSWMGLAFMAMGVVLFMAGTLAGEMYTQRVSMLPVLGGMTILLFGWRVFALSLLPLAYLLFMIPIPYVIYNAIAFPLKLMISTVSEGVFNLIGIMVMREGNVLTFPNVTLEVADACSGMRSLVSLSALGVGFAYLQDFKPWQRITIMLATVPIAIFTNLARVVVTGILAREIGAAAAEGFFHEMAGISTFAIAFFMMLGLGSLLKLKR